MKESISHLIFILFGFYFIMNSKKLAKDWSKLTRFEKWLENLLPNFLKVEEGTYRIMAIAIGIGFIGLTLIDIFLLP